MPIITTDYSCFEAVYLLKHKSEAFVALLLSSSLRHGLRMLLVKDWALYVMIRVANICLKSLRHSALIMAFRGSTLSEIDLSRMV
jgi:hypothetical protein